MTTEAAEAVESVTLTQRERDDMTVVECLLDAGFEIQHEYSGGWDGFGSSFVFEVRDCGNRDKLKRLVDGRFPHASTSVVYHRDLKHYAVVSVEPTDSEWDEIVAYKADVIAEEIKGGTAYPVWGVSVPGQVEAIERLNSMTEAEVIGLFQRLTRAGKIHWQLNTDDDPIHPYWEFHLRDWGLEPQDIR